jgi:Ca2+-dependent lipid-binding protein
MSNYGNLEVTVKESRNLEDVEKLSEIDPYVCIYHGRSRFKTRVIQNGGVNVIWDETFNIPNSGNTLRIECWDAEVFSDRIIGTANVDLNQRTPFLI